MLAALRNGRIAAFDTDEHTANYLLFRTNQYADTCIDGTDPAYVDSGARTAALASKTCDAVFWSETRNFNDREGSDAEDKSEHTIITEPYLGCTEVYVTLSDSPLVQK